MFERIKQENKFLYEIYNKLKHIFERKKNRLET